MHGFFSLEHKHRVCTEFLSKIQDFRWTFSKTIISFSRLKVMKQVINRELKKILQEQSFFHDRQARLNKISQTQKTFHLRSTCCSFKKKSRLFTIFSRLYLYFTEFFQFWKFAWQTSRLFQEFKTLYEPCKQQTPDNENPRPKPCSLAHIAAVPVYSLIRNSAVQLYTVYIV